MVYSFSTLYSVPLNHGRDKFHQVHYCTSKKIYEQEKMTERAKIGINLKVYTADESTCVFVVTLEPNEAHILDKIN